MIKPYQIHLAIQKEAKRLGLDKWDWDQPLNMRTSPGDMDDLMSLFPGPKALMPDGVVRGTIWTTRTDDHPFSISPAASMPLGSVEVEFVTK